MFLIEIILSAIFFEKLTVIFNNFFGNFKALQNLLKSSSKSLEKLLKIS